MSVELRYERYAAWCRMLGVSPAPFETWSREVAKVRDYILSLGREE